MVVLSLYHYACIITNGRMNTKITALVLVVEMWKKQSEHKNYMLTCVGNLVY